MAGSEDDKDKALAEKAYENAASSASDKDKTPVSNAGPDAKPETVKAQAAPTPKAEPAKAVAAAEAKPAATAKSVASEAKAPVPKTKAASGSRTEPAAVAAKPKAAPAAKPIAPKPSAAPIAQAKPKPLPAKPVVAAPAKVEPEPAKVEEPVFKAASKTAHFESPTFAGPFTNFLLGENTMDMSANFSGIHEAMTEAQTKAKAAFDKSTALLGEVSDFTKGNVEAVMESGKILADGVQGLGSEIVAEGRATFETISGDFKELAGAKSPTDFFKIQGDMMRKNFDSAVAYSAKNSEAMLKLVSDAIAPISGRVSLAMEKVRQTSL